MVIGRYVPNLSGSRAARPSHFDAPRRVPIGLCRTTKWICSEFFFDHLEHHVRALVAKRDQRLVLI